MWTKIVGLLAFFICALPPVPADQQGGAGADGGQVFRFVYRESDRYRIVSSVDQEVYIDDVRSHHAEMVNRITVDIGPIRSDGSALHHVDYLNSVQADRDGGIQAFDRSYQSSFYRNSRGAYEVDADSYIPVVRNVPYFPEEPIAPGHTWFAVGEEVHDLRDGFGLDEPFRFPIPTAYRYEGTEERDGAELHRFRIRYGTHHRPGRRYDAAIYPTLVAGYSDQVLWWDAERGRYHSYEERYSIIFTLNTGETVRFSGTAEAYVVETRPLDRDQIVDEIRRDLDDAGMDDTDVRADEEGVTINLDTIQFPPDSATLIDSEKRKLDRIAQILMRYPDHHLLITGHTALAGTAEGRVRLSEDRAAAVGGYLLELGVRAPDALMFRGMGAEVPIAPNTTEAGMRQNRRVEITILDN